MKTLNHITRTNIIAFFVLFISILSASSDTNAQQAFGKKIYKGVTASFGIHSVTSSSNIAQIDQMPVSVAGGQVGVVIGTEVLRYEVGLVGYYSSVNNIVGTIDFYTNHVSLKFYPLNLFELLNPRLEPYFTGGISYDRFKFYGHYANQDETKTNYSADAPYVGNIKQTNATLGAGLNFRILNQHDFVHLFTEIKYAYNLAAITPLALKNTALTNHMMVNIGMSFGIYR